MHIIPVTMVIIYKITHITPSPIPSSPIEAAAYTPSSDPLPPDSSSPLDNAHRVSLECSPTVEVAVQRSSRWWREMERRRGPWTYETTDSGGGLSLA